MPRKISTRSKSKWLALGHFSLNMGNIGKTVPDRYLDHYYKTKCVVSRGGGGIVSYYTPA